MSFIEDLNISYAYANAGNKWPVPLKKAYCIFVFWLDIRLDIVKR